MSKFSAKLTSAGFSFNLVADNNEIVATSQVYTTKAACLVNFIFGAGFMICNMLFKKEDWFPVLLKSPINAGAFVMLAGLIIVPVVSLITPKQDDKEIEKIFSCYNKKNEVPVTQSLSD